MIGTVARRVALILAGLIFIGTVTQMDENRLSTPCPAGSVPVTDTIPVESQSGDPAFFATETISPEHDKMHQLGFTHVVGMYNFVTAEPCDRGEAATVEFRSFRIIEQDMATGETAVAQAISFDDEQLANPHELEHTLFYREPWFTGGTPARQPIVAAREDGVYWLNASFVPRTIIHGWTKPRVETVPGKRYLVEAEVRVSGAARLQLGMDYWRGAWSEYNGWSEGCIASNNCQAWLSDWLGDTGGEFVTWRAPVFRQ